MQSGDAREELPEHATRHGDFGDLESDVAALVTNFTPTLTSLTQSVANFGSGSYPDLPARSRAGRLPGSCCRGRRRLRLALHSHHPSCRRQFKGVDTLIPGR